MWKKMMAMALALLASWSMAAVDVNKANQTELTQVKGIGAATATRILEARKQGAFKNWDDLIARVKGIAGPSASKLSAEGLTVNGQTYNTPAGNPTATGLTGDKSTKPAQTNSKKPEKS